MWQCDMGLVIWKGVFGHEQMAWKYGNDMYYPEFITNTGLSLTANKTYHYNQSSQP